MTRRMKDSGVEWIGCIPEEWNLIKGKNIFAQSMERGNENLILLSATQDRGVIPKESLEGVVQVKEETDLMTFKTVHVGDFIISLRSFQGGFEMSEIEGVITPAYTVFRKKKNIHNNYYKMLFKCSSFIEKMNSLTVGIRDGKNIAYSDFADTLLVVPPIEEQIKIANYLDQKCNQIDKTIEKEKQLIEKLKEYKQSIITEAVTKGLNPNVKMKDSGVEWIGEIPKHWKVVRIKNILTFNPSYSENLNDDDIVSFIPMENLKNNKIEPRTSQLSKVKGGYTYFADNDIIMAKVTPCFENGNIAVTEGLINGVGFGSSELYVFRCTKSYTRYIFYYLQNSIFKQRCISTMYGTGGLKRVSSNFVYNYKMSLPNENEQKQIADYLDKKCSSIDKLISNKEKLIEKLTEYKKSLIYECVTGKREIR